MSVIYFSDEELKSVYEKLSYAVSRNGIVPEISDSDLRRLLRRLGVCNRLAYKLNYLKDETELKLKIPDLDVPEYTELSLKALIDKLDLLEYNCITNGGRCFADQQDRELLRKLTDSLRRRYIKDLENK